MKMDTTGSYLKFLGVIGCVVGGMLLVGFIFKWLGILHILWLICEVVLRALVLGGITFVAALLITVSREGKTYSDTAAIDIKPIIAGWFENIVFFVALLGAAAAMTFWE